MRVSEKGRRLKEFEKRKIIILNYLNI